MRRQSFNNLLGYKKKEGLNKKQNMILVDIKTGQPIKEKNFKSERELHETAEKHLPALLNMELVASEYPTSKGGIIDTLALDKETKTPVIIEYKIEKSKTILNQLSFYYDWLSDHSDTFNRLVKEKLGSGVSVNWAENIRLICIAKEFTEWDFALISHLDTKIELLRYAYYTNGLLSLQEIGGGRRPVPTRKEAFDLEYHRSKGGKETQKLFDEIRKEILDLDEDIEERVTKFYVGYYKDYLFTEIHVRRTALLFNIKAEEDFKDPKKITKDISHRGFAVNREFKITSLKQIPDAMFLIKQSFDAVCQK